MLYYTVCRVVHQGANFIFVVDMAFYTFCSSTTKDRYGNINKSSTSPFVVPRLRGKGVQESSLYLIKNILRAQ